MSRRAASFTQADIARAIRAAKQVGDAYVVEIEPGGLIRIAPGAATPSIADRRRPAEEPERLDIVL